MAIRDRAIPKEKDGDALIGEVGQIKNQGFPWWMVIIGLIIISTFALIQFNEGFKDAFDFIRTGLSVTITTTLIAYACALVIGLLVGLGRVSENRFWKNLATVYVEIIRGVPLLVLIFFIALVLIPAITALLSSLGNVLLGWGLEDLAVKLAAIENRSISMNVRAIISLSITYGAFMAEIFRAGIQSINKGQMEAARSQGMSHWQAMRYVILPQAIKNVLPALGNDLISMLKDSSLVSVLAVRDITQIARLYTGHSFMFTEAYTVLCVLYLTLTLFLSFILKLIERKYGNAAK